MNQEPVLPLANILIVDDAPLNLRLLTRMLSQRGYCTRSATSGAAALATIQIALPDLILLDINMPQMDGYEVCRHLKADDRTRDIPIIFISALNDALDKVLAFQVGGVDYITKPVQLEEVCIRVKHHLHLRQLQIQWSQHPMQLQQAQWAHDRALELN